MKYILLVLLALSMTGSAKYCIAQCDDGSSKKKSNITIAVDGSPEIVEQQMYSVIEMMDLHSHADRSRLFGSGKGRHVRDHYYAPQVPYGRYLVKMQKKSGSVVLRRLLDVCQPRVRVEVSQELARVHLVPLIANENSVRVDPSKFVNVKKFINRADGTDMSSLFKEGVGEQLPYGVYDLVADLSFISITREVDVFQQDVWVFSGSTGFYGDSDRSGPANIITGTITNIPSNGGPIFLILSGIYTPYTINSTVSIGVDGNGVFEFRGTNPNGQFILYTVGSTGILDVRQVVITRDMKIMIDLSRPSLPRIGAPS